MITVLLLLMLAKSSTEIPTQIKLVTNIKDTGYRAQIYAKEEVSPF